MRIAFTSSDGVTVDQHFGMTREFRIWEVGAREAAEVERITALPGGDARQRTSEPDRGFAAGAELDEEDRIAARASAVAGCAIVYTVAIGGPAAAKLVARKIHPIKTGAEVPIAEAISRLQAVLRGTPPPWLR